MSAAFTHDFPRLSAYLETLPGSTVAQKVKSHAGTEARAELLHSIRELHPLPLPAFPDEVRAVHDVMVGVPEPDAWIPEVHHLASLLVTADLLGVDAAGFEDVMYEIVKRQLPAPFYRNISRLFPPREVLRGASFHWDRFHRGLRLGLLHEPDRKSRKQRLRISLSYPPMLLDHTLAAAYIGTWRAVAERTRFPNPVHRLVSYSSTQAVYEMDWSES